MECSQQPKNTIRFCTVYLHFINGKENVVLSPDVRVIFILVALMVGFLNFVQNGFISGYGTAAFKHSMVKAASIRVPKGHGQQKAKSKK